MDLDLTKLATQETFTRHELLTLLGYTLPRLTTVSLIAYQMRNKSAVYLQRNRKATGWVFPGGGQRGHESHGEAVIREAAIEEHPVLSQHIKRDEITLFTVCSVLRPATATTRLPLTKFCDGHGAPKEVVALFQDVQVPLCIGTDIVLCCPVHGDVDVRSGTSPEAIEMGCFDLTLDRVEFGFHHRDVADDWLAFVSSGFTKRPDPTRIYRC